MNEDISWRNIGAIEVRENKLSLPDIPKRPGLYRLWLKDGWCYIGQAKDLRERLGNYCKPTQGTEQEHIMHRAIVLAGGAKIEIYDDEELSDPKTRATMERKAIRCSYKIEGFSSLNKKRKISHRRLLELSIGYYQKKAQRCVFCIR